MKESVREMIRRTPLRSRLKVDNMTLAMIVQVQMGLDISLSEELMKEIEIHTDMQVFTVKQWKEDGEPN